MAAFKDWLTVTWAQGAGGEGEGEGDATRGRCGRAGSLQAPGERLLELLRVGGAGGAGGAGGGRRHSTAACPPRGGHFVYCPSDALPYCPPSRIIAPPPPPPSQPHVAKAPPPPPVPLRSAPPLPPALPPLQAPPAPPRRAPPAPPAPPRRPPVDPPPAAQPLRRSPSNGSAVSVRQDSNVSSDSYSQTSSPSYTTKTMEAPLLPPPRGGSRGPLARALQPRPPPAQRLQPQGPPGQPQPQPQPQPPSITKSASTPASLQTIVRLHNGSNVSLQHRMVSLGGAGAAGPLCRFRVAQLVLNVLVLAAIAVALFAYFRANPTVQYVVPPAGSGIGGNGSAPQPRPAHPPADRDPPGAEGANPAPGLCLPIILGLCAHQRIPYNYTVFPNFMGHFNQRDAQQDLEYFEAVVDVRCYELTALYLCTLFAPKCNALGHAVRPCRSLCTETMRRCGFFLDVFGLSMPDYLQCSMFPESADTSVCLGSRQVKEAKHRATKPTCVDGFQCDVSRCVPRDWRCDGHVDCADRSDELNCRVCQRSGDVHCGNGQCISQAHICDGKRDCLWGQDERNCLRLSEENGDVGRGELQVYRAANQSWHPACLAAVDAPTAAKLCAMLGYSQVNYSSAAPWHWPWPSQAQAPGEARGFGAAQSYRAFVRAEGGLMQELRRCRPPPKATLSPQPRAPAVRLLCTNYECGRRRSGSGGGGGRKRIVGGVEAAPGDWPFLAAILGGPEEVFYCAGVLVADQWVLTASHCVGNGTMFRKHSDVRGWTIQLGITRRRAHGYYGQKVKVRRVVPHPLYSVGVAHDNDVALLQLDQRVRYHEHLAPVCLPPADRELPAGTLCTVIGWGKRHDRDTSEYEPAVNEVQVPVLPRELCNQWLEHRDLNITDGMVCAGYPEGGKDACQGDSGGPLLCQEPPGAGEGRWFVGGIVSWGIKCAHPRLPGVYAFVPKYVPWITRQIRRYDGTDPSPTIPRPPPRKYQHPDHHTLTF